MVTLVAAGVVVSSSSMADLLRWEVVARSLAV
jgi:hypothetical protein